MAERITIQELVVELLFEGSESGIAKFNSALSVFRQLAGAAEMAIGAMTDVVIGSTLRLADEAGALEDHAARVGLAVPEYDALATAMRFAGGEAADLDIALKTLTRQVGAFAATGKGEAAEALQAFLGPDARAQVQGLRQISDVLPLIADGFARVQDPIQRAALLQKILGEGAGKLTPLLQDGADGLRAFLGDAERAGLVSQEFAAQGGLLGDNIQRLELRLRGWQISMGAETIPALVELTGEAVLAVDALREMLLPGVQASARFLAAGFRLLRDVLQGLREDTARATQGLAALKVIVIALAVAALPLVATQLLGLVYWFAAVGRAAIASAARAALAWLVAAAPLVAMVALITGIILLLDDLITYVQGGESAFGALLKKMAEGGPILQGLADVLRFLFGGGLGNSLYDAFEAISALARQVVDDLKAGFAALPAAILGAVRDVVAQMPGILGSFGRGLAAIPGAFAEAGTVLAGGSAARTNNVSVGGSTVAVSVNGAGDPRATGAEVARQVGGALDAQTTRAARDLAPAFAY